MKITLSIPAKSAPTLLAASRNGSPELDAILAPLVKFRPSWHGFNGEHFRDFACDLLRAEGYVVDKIGVGPDGGIDAIATEKISYGYSEPEDVVWAVQCKFSSDPEISLKPKEVERAFEIITDERFKSRHVNGFMVVTNCRLSINTMSQLKGMNNGVPGFKTTYLDKCGLHNVLQRHFSVCRMFLDPVDLPHVDIVVFDQSVRVCETL